MKRLLFMGLVLFSKVGQNEYGFLVKIWRNNNIGWVTESWDAALSFKNYINSIKCENQNLTSQTVSS
jgi:hypothetical protein